MKNKNSKFIFTREDNIIPISIITITILAIASMSFLAGKLQSGIYICLLIMALLSMCSIFWTIASCFVHGTDKKNHIIALIIWIITIFVGTIVAVSMISFMSFLGNNNDNDDRNEEAFTPKGVMMYKNNSIKVRIGDSTSNLHMTKNYENLGSSIFIGHYVEEDTIIDTYIYYYANDSLSVINVEASFDDYMEEFNNCEEDTNSYYCSAGDIKIIKSKEGPIKVYDDDRMCEYNEKEEAYCEKR